jgi:hypothetical protein
MLGIGRFFNGSEAFQHNGFIFENRLVLTGATLGGLPELGYLLIGALPEDGGGYAAIVKRVYKNPRSYPAPHPSSFFETYSLLLFPPS